MKPAEPVHARVGPPARMLLGALLLAGGLSAAEPEGLRSRDGVIWVMTNSQPVRLRHNPAARNPTLATLMQFIRKDDTNQVPYTTGKFVCTEFAVQLQARAERAGLRAGIVFVTFTTGPGHALNVFQTADRGLVFVDCTGGPPGQAQATGAFDTFGYLQKGRPYGRLPLDVGAESPASYAHYERIMSAREKIGIWAQWLESERTGLAADERAIAEAQAHPGIAPEALTALIERHNDRAHLYNARAEIVNRFQLAVEEGYAINPAPVADFEIRW